jgi:hypothetical protein
MLRIFCSSYVTISPKLGLSFKGMPNEIYTEAPSVCTLLSTSVESAFYEHGRIENPSGWHPVPVGAVPNYDAPNFSQHWHSNHPTYLLPAPVENNCNFALYASQVHVHAMAPNIVQYSSQEHPSSIYYNGDYATGNFLLCKCFIYDPDSGNGVGVLTRKSKILFFRPYTNSIP